MQVADHRHRRLLRGGRERPCNGRAAEQRDELTSSQLIELHSIPANQGRIVGYRIGEDQSGGNGTNLQPVSRWRERPFAGRARGSSARSSFTISGSTMVLIMGFSFAAKLRP